MFYTEEEVSVITGLLNAYLVREHASQRIIYQDQRGTSKPCADQGRLRLAGERPAIPPPILVE